MPNSGQNAPGDGLYYVVESDVDLPNAVVLTAGEDISLVDGEISFTGSFEESVTVQDGQTVDEFTPVIALDDNFDSGVILLTGGIDQEVSLPLAANNVKKVITVINGALASRVCKVTGGADSPHNLSPNSSVTYRSIGNAWRVVG